MSAADCGERQTVADRVMYGRAFQCVVWGIPAVNFDRMYQAMVRETGALSTRSCIGLVCRTGGTRR